MGVAIASVFTLAIIVAGTALTALLEPRLYGKERERGPAASVSPRQDVVPPNSDRWLYPVAPIVALLGVALASVVIPFGPKMIGADLGIGAFYIIVVVDFVVLGLALGGWGANTPHAVEVYYRITAQLVAYVVPLGLAYIGAIMMARSLSTVDIVKAQSDLWFIVLQPVGFGLYVATALMQAYRAPFLEPFARSIDHGVLSVYGGGKALLWRIALAGVLFIVAAMGAVLYLGGWQGPLLPGPLWMVIKTFALMIFLIWLGGRVRPLSVAEMLALSWKILIPIGMINVLIVGAMILLGVGPP